MRVGRGGDVSELCAGDSSGFHNDGVNNGYMEDRGIRRSNQVLIWIAGLSVVLLVLAAFITSNRAPNQLDASTPEGIVQSYLTAIIEGRHDEAARYFTKESECDASDIDRAYISDTLRVNLVSSEIKGSSAYVKIDADTSSGGLFEDGYIESHTYRLNQEGSNWRIAGIPWPLWDCGVVDK